MKLLHIDSSVLGARSVSRELTRAVVGEWRRAHPAMEVTYRDVGVEPPAHLSAEILGARFLPAGRTARCNAPRRPWARRCWRSSWRRT